MRDPQRIRIGDSGGSHILNLGCLSLDPGLDQPIGHHGQEGDRKTSDETEAGVRFAERNIDLLSEIARTDCPSSDELRRLAA